MNERAEWIRQVQACEDETAVAIAAKSELVELRLALRAARRRGGYFDPENVATALAAMPVIERALLAYCARLGTERVALRSGERG